MKQALRLCKFLLKVSIFFTLFAFALNNQHAVTIHFFFGQQWTAPLVLLVFSVFGLGLLIGVLSMVPRWWRQRSATSVENKPIGTSAKTQEPAAEIFPHGL